MPGATIASALRSEHRADQAPERAANGFEWLWLRAAQWARSAQPPRRDPILQAHLTAAARMVHAITGVQPWANQLQAAQALMQGRFVEMATGEGKSLALALAAAAQALNGTAVHLMTANDYLVQRDAEAASPWWRALGLSVGVVTSETPAEERRRAYRCHITVCTAREVAFDHLRDAQAGWLKTHGLRLRAESLGDDGSMPQAGADGSGPLLPGLSMAIVDEADSLLIDEGSMPLVLAELASGPAARAESARSRAMAFQALGLARRFRVPEDVASACGTSGAGTGAWVWTSEALARLEQAALPLGGLWFNRRHRLDQVEAALHALHGLVRDRDYVVVDGRVHIVDAVTGRTATGRQWSRGLQALVELKEGCAVQPPSRVMARISLQRFFMRYHSLAGTSGSLSECRRELMAAFGARVETVPLRVPSRRVDMGLRVFATKAGRWQALPCRVAQAQATGQPVLVGTDSVADTDAACAALAREGLAHQRLDARHDAHEATVVARAGEAGAVTVATQMAGRGTDIHLSPDARTAGGLLVLACQDNASARLDRQLIGRSARAGDPGAFEIWRALEAPAWQVPDDRRQGMPAAGPRADALTADDGEWPTAIDRLVHWLARQQRAPLGPEPPEPAGLPVPSSPGPAFRQPQEDRGCAPAWLRAWFGWRQIRHERAAALARRALLEQDLQWQTRTGYLPTPE